MNKNKKYALVLSGGGFKAAFQLGVLNYLNDNWKRITGDEKMHFDIISSVSGGALNGAFIAMNELEQLNYLWLKRIALHGASEIYNSDFIDTYSQSDQITFKPNLKKICKRLIPNFKTQLSLKDKFLALFSKKHRSRITKQTLKKLRKHIIKGYEEFRSIADNSPLKQKLYLYLDRSKIKETKFYSGFVSLDTGKYHSVEQNSFVSENDFLNAVLASTSIPLVWKPVPKITFKTKSEIIHSKNNVDGGVRNISPLEDVIRQINEDKEHDYQIIIINCHSQETKQESYDNKPAGAILSRSIQDIALNEIFQNDLDHLLEINNLVKQAEAWDHEITLFNRSKQPIKAFDALIVNPNPEVDLGNSLVANKKLIEKRYNHGYNQAEKSFSKFITNDH